MSLADFRFDADEIKIIPCGDWHFGHKACQVDAIQGTIDYIKNSENTYTILMGDMIESSSKTSVGAGWLDQKITPDEQMDAIVDMLKPIQPKILGAITGNHEARAWKDVGFDVTKRYCRELGIPYWGIGKLIRIKVKDYNYVFYVFHGSSKATTAQGKMLACKKLRNTAEADIYCCAHTHHLAVDSMPIFRPNIKDKVVDIGKKYFVLTGYYVDYWGTYAHSSAFDPGKTGCAKIKLFGQKWDIHVSV